MSVLALQDGSPRLSQVRRRDAAKSRLDSASVHRPRGPPRRGTRGQRRRRRALDGAGCGGARACQVQLLSALLAGRPVRPAASRSGLAGVRPLAAKKKILPRTQADARTPTRAFTNWRLPARGCNQRMCLQGWLQWPARRRGRRRRRLGRRISTTLSWHRLALLGPEVLRTRTSLARRLGPCRRSLCEAAESHAVARRGSAASHCLR